jgi:crotonobetainyl-CoA:carnitine CoA-transferase CaiB-like acyl-CoA transferase
MTQKQNIDRRQFMKTTGAAAVGAFAASMLPGTANAASHSADFDINAKFAEFMSVIGGTPGDAGGAVTFTGEDPILRSHFRIGSCMAIPAMAAGVGAAAIWRDRTGEGQDLKVDLRESIYNLNPIIGVVSRADQAAGIFAEDDPIPNSFTFVPTLNGMGYQAPLMIGHPLSFATFETKDGRQVTPTGAYPHLYHGFLNVIGASPNTESMAAAIKQWSAVELDDAVADAGYIMGLHRTKEEWAQHPEGKHLASTPVIDIRKVGDAEPRRTYPLHPRS